MKIWLIALFFVFGARAQDIACKQSEPQICETLVQDLQKGVPHLVDGVNTGKTLQITREQINSIERVDGIFKVWAHDSGYYAIEYSCFDASPCLFIWNGTSTIH